MIEFFSKHIAFIEIMGFVSGFGAVVFMFLLFTKAVSGEFPTKRISEAVNYTVGTVFVVLFLGARIISSTVDFHQSRVAAQLNATQPMVFKDTNGCEYLQANGMNSALTPRLGPEGKQLGCIFEMQNFPKEQ